MNTMKQQTPDEMYASWQKAIADGIHDGGTCNACGLPIVDHPLPDRFHESKPEHCQAAKAKKGQP